MLLNATPIKGYHKPNLTFGGSGIKYHKPNLTFGGSGIKYHKPNLTFVESDIKYHKPNLTFVESGVSVILILWRSVLLVEEVSEAGENH
jgi:hypothetical protein